MSHTNVKDGKVTTLIKLLIRNLEKSFAIVSLETIIVLL